jgi:hypothetical protein
VADGTGADPDVEPDVDDLVAWIADRVGAEQPVYQPRHRLAHVRSP